MAAIVLFLCYSAVDTQSAYGQTISWINPQTYNGMSSIPSSVRATIETRLYFSRDGESWTQFATVANGGESWTGTLPTADGATGYYGATATIPSKGIESPLSNIVAYTPDASAPVTGVSARFDEVTVTLGNYQDTYVALSDETSHSGSPLIRTYVWPARSVANRGFLRWDVSSIPTDARITNATLRLYYTDEAGGGVDNDFAVSVARVIGTNLDPTAATWNSPDGVTAWTGGADGGAKNIAARESVAVVDNTHGWVVWNVTGMVRDWVKAPQANFGMALDPYDPKTADGNRYFASGEHPDPLLRPELVVTYLQPAGVAAPQGAFASPASPNVPAGAFSDAFTASIGGFEDTYVNTGSYGDANYAYEPMISAYTWPANNVANRGFMRWDLSGLPGNITVTNAALWLFHVYGWSESPVYTVSVAKVTGVLPDLGRATWNRFDGVSPWPGGENGGAAAMEPPFSSAAIGMTPRWVSWDVTEMVQGWADRPEANFGMAIEGDWSAGSDSYRVFASGDHPDPSLRPRLLVTYVKNP